MAGPQDIQRNPQGLLTLLGMASGGETPRVLSPAVSGVVDLLQFYGRTQRQALFAQNAVAAEAAVVNIGTVPNGQYWLFFHGFTRIVKTATMTALRGTFQIDGNVVASEELGPFGATETGAVHVPFFAPYPLLLLPGTSIQVTASIIGTDATADVSGSAIVGVLA